MSMLLKRNFYMEQLRAAIARSPVTALIEPRQCGKTTLARQFAKGRRVTHFDLESPIDQRRFQNPELMLKSLSSLVVLDLLFHLKGNRYGMEFKYSETPKRSKSMVQQSKICI